MATPQKETKQAGFAETLEAKAEKAVDTYAQKGPWQRRIALGLLMLLALVLLALGYQEPASKLMGKAEQVSTYQFENGQYVSTTTPLYDLLPPPTPAE